MRTGVRLAVDVGTVRVGVARSDPSGLLAVPVETVRRGEGDLDRLAALAEEHDVLEVVVGLPITFREGGARRGGRPRLRPCARRACRSRTGTAG
jgi:putative Holliday junction resolvase